MYLLSDSLDKKFTKGMLGLVKEDQIAYSRKANLHSSSISDWLQDKLLLSLIIRKGLSYDLFDIIQQSSPYKEQDWAGFLGVSTKSMQRYQKENKTFKPIQTEKIFEVTEVTILGLDIFGDASKFMLWMQTPNFALGGIVPIHLLSDSYGKDLVMASLTRLDHGIFI